MPTFELVETAGGSEGGGGSTERKPFEPIEEDTVIEAVVAAVKVEPHKHFKDDEGNPEIKVNFEFNFELNGQKRKLWGDTPTTFTTHPDCKLRNWVQQILGGGELPAGFKLNTDTLVDTPVRIVVGYRSWDKDGKKGWKNEVKDLMYSKNSAASTFEDPF